MNQFSRNVALWLVLGLMILLLFNLLTRQQPKLQDISFSDFMAAVEKGEVSEVEMEGQNIHGKFHNNERFKSYAPERPGSGQDPARQGRQDHRQAGGR